MSRLACILTLAALASFPAFAQQQNLPADELTPNFKAPVPEADYVKRVVMIPMRDGVKLYTVIVIPKGAKDAPILLTRTPYDAASPRRRARISPHMLDALPLGDEVFVSAGYIRVYQDVRGKYGSEGDYVMTPPPVGPLNPTGADDTTDAWDTIDWLVKNVPESNGRVGMIGSSYEGFTVVMALLDPHPALKVAAPESPMVDGWMGDDWFHYGASAHPTSTTSRADHVTAAAGDQSRVANYDDYTNSARRSARQMPSRAAGGLDQLPFWRIVDDHPAYDAFWQSQALDKLIAKAPLKVPTCGSRACGIRKTCGAPSTAIDARRAQRHAQQHELPRHGAVAPQPGQSQGSLLGPLHWEATPPLQFRRDVLLPFFNQYLGRRRAQGRHARRV